MLAMLRYPPDVTFASRHYYANTQTQIALFYEMTSFRNDVITLNRTTTEYDLKHFALTLSTTQRYYEGILQQA